MWMQSIIRNIQISERSRSMRVIDVIFSPTGGTKKVADILIEEIKEDKERTEVDLCDNQGSWKETVFGQEDIVILSVPSYGGHVPFTAIDRIRQLKGNGARAILVCVYGNRHYDNTLAELCDIVQKAGFQVRAAVAGLAEHSIKRTVAAGRPDGEDQKCLKNMAKQIAEKLASGNSDMPKIPGRVVERKPSSGAMMCPVITEVCGKCGVCVSACPVGAIDADTLKSDSTKCISCMRCVTVCPEQKRTIKGPMVTAFGIILPLLCKKRKENELFL